MDYTNFEMGPTIKVTHGHTSFRAGRLSLAVSRSIDIRSACASSVIHNEACMIHRTYFYTLASIKYLFYLIGIIIGHVRPDAEPIP